MYLFVLILSIKDQGRAVEKARGSTGSIRRGVTLEYDDQGGKRSKWVQIPNWRCPTCSVPYKSAQLVMPRHKNSASVLTVTLVMVHQ